MSSTTHTSAAAALILAAGLLLTGCGDDTSASSTAATASASSTPTAPTSSASSGTSTDSTSPTPSGSPATGTTLAVTIKGDEVTPQGRRIKTTVGQPVIIRVDSDRAGELHVHSTPEQELEYDEGSTTLTLKIDKPGIVDIEDHIADVVIAQLEVS